jgi:CheY-like chemotaxis protein
MDLSDIARKEDGTTTRAGSASPSASGAPDAERWPQLLCEMGAEIAAPLTAALERVYALTATGRIDRAGLRALREEVEQARQTAMYGQQLTRFASGRLRQSHERLQLADTLQSVLAHRQRETQARGIVLRPALKPAEVIVDPTLLFSLLNTVLDWALVCSRSNIEFSIDLKTWPVHARLKTRFAWRPADLVAEPGVAADKPAPLDALAWRLIEQTCATMGLPLERSEQGGEVVVTIEFPRTATGEVPGISTMEIDDGFAPSTNSKPLAGSQVLVISSRRDVRAQIREALKNMGLIIDFVNTVEEAVVFCRDGLPHAIIIESILRGERFAQLREEIVHELPDFVFIEIIEEGTVFEMSGFSGAQMARVGRAVIESSLPSALMFELSKSL